MMVAMESLGGLPAFRSQEAVQLRERCHGRVLRCNLGLTRSGAFCLARSSTCDGVSALVAISSVLLACLAGCGSADKYKVLRLDGAPDAYRSEKWTVSSQVKIDKTHAGLHCEVRSDNKSKTDAYGGIMVPAEGAKSWRLELGFPEPEGVVRVYVDGYNNKHQRVCRWQTQARPKLRRERTTYVFVPRQKVDSFEPVASTGSGSIDKIHVFVSLKSGSRTSFDLFAVELLK